MKEAKFFKDVNDLSELKMLTEAHRGTSFPFRIISSVNLDKLAYEKFCSNFKKSYSFLYPFIDSSRVSGDVWDCVLIKHESDVSILVMTNGYQYPRFVAVLDENYKE